MFINFLLVLFSVMFFFVIVPTSRLVWNMIHRFQYKLVRGNNKENFSGLSVKDSCLGYTTSKSSSM